MGNQFEFVKPTNMTAEIISDHNNEQMSNAIWQEAASPPLSSHPSRLRMDSSDINPHLIYGSFSPHESATQTVSRSVQANQLGL